MKMHSVSHPLSACCVLLLLLLVTGCATTAGGSGGSGDRDVLTRSEIQEANINTNAYDAVRRLRPEWLNTRSGRYLPVYVNGSRFGERVTALRQLNVSNISRLELLSSSEATTRFGSGNMNGAIVVES